MYQDFFGLNRAPFGVTPDPDFLSLSASQKEALATIVYGVDQRKGFIVLVGEVGLGKTTILRFYLDTIATERLTTAYVFHANVTFKALLDTIFRELDIADRPESVHDMVHRLHEVFIEEYRRDRNIVLVVDEAQNMPIETLENLRVLSNLETSTDKLLQMVLVGQPEFARKLEKHGLRQLNQRVGVRATLVPFTESESLAYIEHRLNKAGGSSASVFTRGALRAIVEHARGVPRVINILCDNAMVIGLGSQQKPVTARMVREAIGDLTGRARVRWRPWAWASLAAVVAAGGLFLASPYREVLFASANAAIDRPALPPAPPWVLPVAAGGENWLSGPGRGADASRERFAAVVVVEEGDTLVRLARAVYGLTNERILQQVYDTNPSIKDWDRLFVGTTIRFPAIRPLDGGASQSR